MVDCASECNVARVSTRGVSKSSCNNRGSERKSMGRAGEEEASAVWLAEGEPGWARGTCKEKSWLARGSNKEGLPCSRGGAGGAGGGGGAAGGGAAERSAGVGRDGRGDRGGGGGAGRVLVRVGVDVAVEDVALGIELG